MSFQSAGPSSGSLDRDRLAQTVGEHGEAGDAELRKSLEHLRGMSLEITAFSSG